MSDVKMGRTVLRENLLMHAKQCGPGSYDGMLAAAASSEIAALDAERDALQAALEAIHSRADRYIALNMMEVGAPCFEHLVLINNRAREALRVTERRADPLAASHMHKPWARRYMK